VSVGPGKVVHAFLREVNRPAIASGEPHAEAAPVVVDEAFLDTFVDQMEELRSSVTAEELYAHLMDQDQQLRRLQAWLDTLTG
jgi:hypothetical protein